MYIANHPLTRQQAMQYLTTAQGTTIDAQVDSINTTSNSLQESIAKSITQPF